MSLLLSDPGSSSSASLDSPQSPERDKPEPETHSTELQHEWVPRQRQEKVAVRLQAIGSTPAIHPASFNVGGTQTIASMAKYIMKKLRLNSIHIYVSSSFEPTPEESLGDLYDNFKTKDVLNLSYCETIAFG